jgi:predicted RNase H-like HicB family nuclease
LINALLPLPFAASVWPVTCAKIVDMKRPFSATVWREGDWFVSQCLEVDVASQGQTEDEALANLREALELHFEPPVATRPPVVRHIEVEVGAA